MTENVLTLGSLFDGSGGFPLGGMLAGIKPIWASEIEPFPIRVTTKRLPEIKHYGDINKLNGAELEPVDIITFGSPCQDLSHAGKRVGIQGSRSSLFFEAVRVIKEMRKATNGKYPRFIVWENVSGARSSNKGKDFKEVLKQICSIKEGEVSIPKPDKGKWLAAGEIVGDSFSVAWRQLDAVNWGVPQRRKRIYLVADFASRGGAGKILFESEGLSRYSPQSFKTWQTITRCSETGSGNASELCLNDQGGSCIDVSHNITGTLRAEMHGHQPVVLQENKDETVVYGISGYQSNAMKSANPNSGIYEAESACTLDLNGGNPNCNQGGMMICSPYPAQPKNYLFENHGQDARYKEIKDHMPTLNASLGTGGNNQPLVVCKEEETYLMTHASHLDVSNNLAYALAARDYKNPPVVTGKTETKYIVRKLTPIECARLQGFPDWWCFELGTENPTDEEISWWKEIYKDHAQALGKTIKPKTDNQIRKWLKDPYSASAEYKMWGNGVALPCVYFVMAGIEYVNSLPIDELNAAQPE